MTTGGRRFLLNCSWRIRDEFIRNENLKLLPLFSGSRLGLWSLRLTIILVSGALPRTSPFKIQIQLTSPPSCLPDTWAALNVKLTSSHTLSSQTQCLLRRPSKKTCVHNQTLFKNQPRWFKKHGYCDIKAWLNSGYLFLVSHVKSFSFFPQPLTYFHQVLVHNGMSWAVYFKKSLLTQFFIGRRFFH